MVDSQQFLQAYIPDDERDAILDKLLTLPENKVRIKNGFNRASRCVSIVRARTPNGPLQTSGSSCVTSALPFTETSVCTSHLFAHLKWTGGRQRRSSAWSWEATSLPHSFMRGTRWSSKTGCQITRHQHSRSTGWSSQRRQRLRSSASRARLVLRLFRHKWKLAQISNR